MGTKNRNILILVGLASVILTLISLLACSINKIKVAHMEMDRATILSEDLLAVGSKTYYVLLGLQEYAYRFSDKSFLAFKKNKIELFNMIDELSGTMAFGKSALYEGGREEINILFAGLRDVDSYSQNLFALLDQYRAAVRSSQPQSLLDKLDADIRLNYVASDEIYDRLSINSRIGEITDKQAAYRDQLRLELENSIQKAQLLGWALILMHLILLVLLAMNLKKVLHWIRSSSSSNLNEFVSQNKSKTKARI